jgi:hypothetical protein
LLASKFDMRCEQKPRDPRWEQIESSKGWASSVWKEASAAKPISYEADRKRTSAAGTGEGPKRGADHREIPKSFQNQVCEVIA